MRPSMVSFAKSVSTFEFSFCSICQTGLHQTICHNLQANPESSVLPREKERSLKTQKVTKIREMEKKKEGHGHRFWVHWFQRIWIDFLFLIVGTLKSVSGSVSQVCSCLVARGQS
mmetsp:Transcript_14471/g.31470  ORF Transcript_14471/g.31470 Transcript_14471/m.31470 type:complete len:115 (+) Transcript_14471:132-476(+)